MTPKATAEPLICSACYYGLHDRCMRTDHPDVARCQCNRYTCALRSGQRLACRCNAVVIPCTREADGDDGLCAHCREGRHE